MTRVHRRVRSLYYPIVVSPVLTPGVILGISTLVFWDRLGTLMDADYESLYYSGLFLTIVGQSTFISAYTMLVFLPRPAGAHEGLGDLAGVDGNAGDDLDHGCAFAISIARLRCPQR